MDETRENQQRTRLFQWGFWFRFVQDELVREWTCRRYLTEALLTLSTDLMSELRFRLSKARIGVRIRWAGEANVGRSIHFFGRQPADELPIS